VNKILITAFEPFGTHKFLTLPVGGRNESRKMLHKLAANIASKRIIFMELEVSQTGIDRLNEAIKLHKPKGIFSMGEHAAILSPNIEAYANDIHRTSLPLLFKGNKRIMSKAAVDLGANVNSSKIGAYYCNNVYLDCLKWVQLNGGHSIFLHLPVLKSSTKNYKQVKDIFKDFLTYIDRH